jgi:hypothetical protein
LEGVDHRTRHRMRITLALDPALAPNKKATPAGTGIARMARVNL